MRTIFRLIFCMAFLIGWGLAALSLHVIRTPDQIPFALVTKERLSFRDTYVDTRAWTMDDVPRHPELVARLIRSGQADLLRHVVAGQHSVDVSVQLGDALQRAPRTGGHDLSADSSAAKTSSSWRGWF